MPRQRTVGATLVATASILAGMTWSGSAAAQGQIQLTDPHGPKDRTLPGTPTTSRTFHMHDGFYLRMNLGLGLGSSSFKDADPSQQNSDADGSNLSLDLLIGGAPSPGFVLGGGLLTDTLFSADFEQGGRAIEERDFTMFLIGPFVDGYFNPRKGWHAGGMAGFSTARLEDVGDFVTNSNGFGIAAWLGKDYWVAHDWSVGWKGRILAAKTYKSDDTHDINATSLSFTLMFTTVYQ